MAKEMMIVFVYDAQACTNEEDDPADAVLYFHPGWVSDTQRHALAGQVVGAAHCVKSLFSQPLAITLQCGKFMLREYGRYTLAVGSDRNIPDWVLRNRTSLLTSILRVYHGDLACLAERLPPGARLADQLYRIMETYLPVLQYGTHIFQRVPLLALPKSDTSVYMEAMQILDHCRKYKGVLGGVILYNNKIVGTQLPPGLTSYLAVADPQRVASPAERAAGAGAAPLGSQLLTVYVGRKSHAALVAVAQREQAFSERGEEIVAAFRKASSAESMARARDFPPGGMKRSRSLLCTAVPEELPPAPAAAPAMPDVVPFSRPRRPNKLALSFKTQPSVEEKDDEAVKETIFTGQTSVCSTPMVEYKRLHGNVLSICQNPNQETDKKISPDVLKNTETSAKIEVKNEKRNSKIVMDLHCMGDHYINKPAPMRKLASVADIQAGISKLAHRATAKFKFKHKEDIDVSPERGLHKSLSSMSINDPTFPVFSDDGKEISQSLFNQYLEQNYANMTQELDKDMFTFNAKGNLIENESKSPQRTPKKVKPKDSTKTLTTDQSRRKSLSLPLKSLSDSDQEDHGMRRKLGGVQLTPLMEKLSHLAFSDKSSGYSSRVTTPMELRETPAVERTVSFTDRPAPPRHESLDDDDDVPLSLLPHYSSHAVRSALFVSGLQSMALLVLIDMAASDDAQLLNNLWETSLNSLGSLESLCLNALELTDEAASDYSYLTLDPQWGTVQKGGAWAALDIATMGRIHSELDHDPALDDLVLRSAESVVLGVCSGGARVYYGERGAAPPGPPAPADPLCAAPLRARRRLQRDRSIVIL